MMSCVVLHSGVSAALKDAAVWRLLGLLFECPGPEWMDQVVALGSDAAEPGLRKAVPAARQEAAPELYHSTFGPGGPAAPREVSYQRGVLPGALLADLRAAYAAFAYQPTIEEPPDHIAVETGFVAYLHLKRAYALTDGDQTAADLCADVADRFAREHLARIAEPLARALECSGITYLAEAAEVLRARVGPPPAERSLEVLDESTETDMES